MAYHKNETMIVFIFSRWLGGVISRYHEKWLISHSSKKVLVQHSYFKNRFNYKFFLYYLHRYILATYIIHNMMSIVATSIMNRFVQMVIYYVHLL